MNPDTFDYLIIGGGSAGCVLAARLSEDPLVRVALPEAGPTDRNVLIHCPLGIAGLALTAAAAIAAHFRLVVRVDGVATVFVFGRDFGVVDFVVVE